jgi:soluble lytic murein transglycosylase-like protein
MMRAVTTIGLGLLLLGLAPPAEASFYTCTDKTGKTWVTNYKVKGARCRLAIKTSKKPKPKPAPRKPEVVVTAPVTSPQVIYQNAPAPAPIIIYRDGPAPTNSAQIVMPPERRSPRHSRGSAADEPRDRAGRERLYAPYVEEAARTYDLPEAFLQAVIRTESDFKYRAKRKDGARGLMQLTAATVRALRVTDPYDPRANVLAGARAIRALANRFEGDMVQVLAAYRGEDDPTARTADRYIKTVLDHYYGYKGLTSDR